MLKEEIKNIVTSQKESLKLNTSMIDRELFKKLDLNLPHAIIISGIRRCGKSTLLRQMLSKRGGNYFNFEDPRAANFTLSDFEKLEEVFLDVNGDSNNYFFDEIQNIPGWEKQIRGMLDRGKKCIITGSNASMLSRELGTKLTGRHLMYELFPFSYREMLLLRKLIASESTFKSYLEKGGFPEYLTYGSEESLQQVLRDIIAKDITLRYGLRNDKIILDMALYLLGNIGKEFSYNSLKKLFSLGSATTIVAYVDHFESSYLVFTLPRFDFSYKKQLVAPKKIYAIDTGFAKANTPSFTEDKGRLLENYVYLMLRRKHKELYYYKDKGECDFLVREKGAIIQAVQVTYSLTGDNLDRETKGLLEAMGLFKLSEGTIYTFGQDDVLIYGSKKIRVISLWNHLSDESTNPN